MAQQNKAQDAVAAAMTAIEEALNMSVADAAAAGKAPDAPAEAKSATPPAKSPPAVAADAASTSEPRALPSPIRPAAKVEPPPFPPLP